ncbi:DUF72 domain-containing protein [Pantoea sp. 1.19]|uniref:DUF72 domain-containing protein n=1 Tax=Pantoea sp. 1.19 TaxID=1925589 RepID=UPI0009489111|nr:DUF72 domain-containing protein [Pantoea sp. 1.19]
MPPIRLGLPQWQHPQWKRFGIATLADYARYFDCVEGNTTLYALPRAEIVMRWRDMTHDDFRFCFKFPHTISHQAALQQCDDLLAGFFQLMAPLAARIGHYWLQLPARFGPDNLPALWAFLDGLPAAFRYSVEVRHPAFFAKQAAEQALNRGLHQRGINRVILDSRGVHQAQPTTPAIVEAQRKKPRLPVHALITAQDPLIRFIGGEDIAANVALFDAWLTRLPEWCERSQPWLFIHTPDIGQVLPLIQALWPRLAQRLPALGPTPNWPQQASLFS